MHSEPEEASVVESVLLILAPDRLLVAVIVTYSCGFGLACSLVELYSGI